MLDIRIRTAPNKTLDYPAILPFDDEAIQIATKFLKDRDLYPYGINKIALDHEFACSAREKEETISYGQIDVWFVRSLNGLKVKCTQLEVGVGCRGDVIEYFANWRNYTPYQELPIISATDAFNRLKEEGVGIGLYDPDLVRINRVYLAYETEPAAYREFYLQPVWVFEGVIDNNGTTVRDIYKTIPAVSINDPELIPPLSPGMIERMSQETQ